MNFSARVKIFALVMTGLGVVSVEAHPVPDIPIRSHFDGEGNLTIRVEIDWRAYLEDPESELYMLKWYYDRMDDEEKAEHIAPAQQFIDERVVFEFEPSGVFRPEFEKWEWRKLGDFPLEELDDEVVMVGEWTTRIPPGTTGYKISANKVGGLTVIFENHIAGEKQERFAGLWPGESSFTLDVAELAPAAPASAAAEGKDPKPEADGGDPESAEDDSESEAKRVAMIAFGSLVVVGGVVLIAGVLMRRRRD